MAENTVLAKPDYDSEIKDCNDIFDNILRGIKLQRGYHVDTALLLRAYNKAKELHEDVRRHSGVLYLRHPLAVANSLANLKCKTSILAAALLHDTIEDCPPYNYEKLRGEFNDEIAEIVSAVTAIKAVEKETDESFSSLSEEDKHEVLDRLTDAKLIQSSRQREAFLVRFADREHNLSTIDACTPAKRRLKIEQTRAFLIPAANRLGMRYYEIALNDLCLKFDEDPIEYRILSDCRNHYISISSPAFTQFETVLQQGIKHQTFFSFPSFNPLARWRGMKKDGRDVRQLEIRRLLKPYELKIQVGDGQAFMRRDVCLSEVLLTCSGESRGDILPEFIDFFKKYLRPFGMFFEFMDEDEYALRVKVTDTYENNYRLVLIRAADLEAYFIGNPSGAPLSLIDERSIADALRPKITVYAYSGYKPLRKFENIVPEGATALDFAFIVSPTMAHTVKAARIKKMRGGSVTFSPDDHLYPKQTILYDNDVVYFDADYQPRIDLNIQHTTIEWFGYINTEHAKNELIDYFKKIYPSQQ